MDVSGNHGQGDAWLVHMTQNITAVQEPITVGKILLSPNPAQTVVYFSQSCNYRLYDLAGREISTGKNAAQIDLAALRVF